jgi:hypothetical protein
VIWRVVQRVGGERGSVERAENIGRQIEFIGRVWGKERLFSSGVEDREGAVGVGRGSQAGSGLVGVKRLGIVRPLGVPSVILLKPEDEIKVFRVLLDKEQPFLEIFEAKRGEMLPVKNVIELDVHYRCH